MSDTPRTSEEWRRIQRLPDGRYSSQVTYEDLAHGMCNFAKQLERELAEMDSKNSLLWQSIQAGSKEQTRLKNELAEVTKQRDLLIEGLEKLASCDWVITLPDRMDAVRDIARETLNLLKQ